MFIPVAQMLERDMGLVFADNVTYQFTCHGVMFGKFWTKDIKYTQVAGMPTPPPPSPECGCPFIETANQVIRLATND